VRTGGQRHTLGHRLDGYLRRGVECEDLGFRMSRVFVGVECGGLGFRMSRVFVGVECGGLGVGV
jgi:hypothetical protein